MGKNMWLYILRRMIMIIPQMLAISLTVFLLVRLIPGDPAYVLLGPLVSDKAREALREEMGFSKPLPLQYVIYLGNLVQGDWGTSITTSQPVLEDLLLRLPATLELITFGLLSAVIIGVSIGVLTSLSAGGWLDRFTRVYGLAAGALPDFWVALILIFFLNFKLGWFPPPIGRISLLVTAPPRITGFYTIDSLLMGNREALISSASHLMLPVMSLAFVWSGLVIRMTRSAMDEILNSDFINHARALGLPRNIIWRYALRNAAPPILTMIAIVYGFLLGGTVLIEKVFSWNGVGQYAVQTIGRADYFAIQGFVLVAAVFTLMIYVVLDILYAIIDPRITFA